MDTMKEKMTSIEKHPRLALRFLLCDTTGNFDELWSSDEQRVSSPIQCFDKTVDEKPEIVLVRFGRISFREREDLVELSAALKRNSHTQMCPTLALLHTKHRKLMEDLKKAKVDYIRYVGDGKLASAQVREIINGLGPADRLERHLAMLCPFLHYSKIDCQHEMTVCGAYLDRMVLGGRRLHEICETEAHLHCEYYLKPRLMYGPRV